MNLQIFRYANDETFEQINCLIFQYSHNVHTSVYDINIVNHLKFEDQFHVIET